MRFPILIILFGILLIFLGTFLAIFQSAKFERDVEYAGFIFIGPFPIGIASSKKFAYFSLLFVLLFFIFVFSFFKYLLR